MTKEILYTTAVDEYGHLVHIDEAKKDLDYYCPVCKDGFILRKSGKTGKGARRPHFAHNHLSPNCTPEGVLHYSFKTMLVSLLAQHKSRDEPYPMNWTCRSCGKVYSGDLLNKAALIRTEYVTDACRPDIALIDGAGRIIAAIEVVVSHRPEETALQYYAENKVALIQLDLRSDEDLTRVEAMASNPGFVDYCHNPTCGVNTVF